MPAGDKSKASGGSTRGNTANLRAPWKPGESGNPKGRPVGDAKMRGLMAETFHLSRKDAIAALRRRWASVKHVQNMVELYAKLEGELSKDAATGGGGAIVIVLNNQGAQPLDPEVFRRGVLQRAATLAERTE